LGSSTTLRNGDEITEDSRQRRRDMTPRRDRNQGFEALVRSELRSGCRSEGIPERVRLVGEADQRLSAAGDALVYALATSTADLADASWNAARLIERARIILKGVE
jgi:hypothetical protein